MRDYLYVLWAVSVVAEASVVLTPCGQHYSNHRSLKICVSYGLMSYIVKRVMAV